MILAIDTSCDETSAAVTDGRRVLSNVISSQVDLHKKYGGVFPALAKRAHQERIDFVVEEALRRASSTLYSPLKSSNYLKENEAPPSLRSGYLLPLLRRERNPSEAESSSHSSSNLRLRFSAKGDKGSLKDIKAVAVTQGPGLAIALEVGIRKAKEICENPLFIRENPRIPLIAINHLEGHIYSCLAQNRHGLPERDFLFPTLCLIVSGGHTELVLMKDHGKYEVVGETLDDACGEALDKAAKILKLGYPGGPIIERLAEDFIKVTPCSTAGCHLIELNRPLKDKSNLNFSYSGLKTQLLYLVEKMPEEEFNKSLVPLAFSFQEACFEQIVRKTSQAIKVYQPKMLVCGGGVIANKYLRKLLRKLAKQNNLPILFPARKDLITDNAAMIGIAAYYKLLRKEFVKDIESLEREPRLNL